LVWRHKKKCIDLYDRPGARVRKEVRQAREVINWCDLENRSTLLDVACGTGDPARGIAAQAPTVQVVGVDLSATRIKQGKKWASEDGLVNIEFVICDADRFPFKDEAFEVATCIGAFHHFPNPPKTICEIARVLGLGGRLVLSTVLVPEDKEGYDFINMLSRLGVWLGGCLGYPSKSELSEILEACGFEAKLIQRDADNWKGKNRQLALVGERVAKAARSARPELKSRFKVKVEGEKVFFNYPGPQVIAVADKATSISADPQQLPQPRYLKTIETAMIEDPQCGFMPQ